MVLGWLLFTIAGGFAAYELIIFIKSCIAYKKNKQNKSNSGKDNIVEINDNGVE